MRESKLKTWTAWLLQISVIPLLFLIPIYTDEIAYKILHARFLIDGIFANSVYPQCWNPGNDLNVPVLFWPFRFLASLIYSAHFSPLWIRLLSCLHVLVATGFVLYISQQFYKKRPFLDVTCLFLIAITPMSLVFSRPEFVIFSLLACSILVSYNFYHAESVKKQCWLALVLLLMFIGILSFHLKSLFFFPMFFLVFLFSPLRRWWKVAFIALLCLTVFSVRRSTSEQLLCPDSPITAEIWRGEALNPVDLVADPIKGIGQLLENLSRSRIYFESLMYRRTYTSGWLPQTTFYNLGGEIINNLATFYFFCFALLILAAIGKAIYLIFSRKCRLDDLVLIGMFVYFLIVSSIQTFKNAYEATLLVPMFVVSFIIAFNKFNCEKFKYISLFRTGLLAVVLMSLAANYYSFRSPYQDWLTDQNLKFQRHSFTLFYYYAHKDVALELYRECGLPDDVKDAKHLVLDDVTYGYFYKSQRPYHVLYLVGKWGKATEKGLVEFLNERKSSGILARCYELPEEYQAISLKRDDFCCLKL